MTDKKENIDDNKKAIEQESEVKKLEEVSTIGNSETNLEPVKEDVSKEDAPYVVQEKIEEIEAPEEPVTEEVKTESVVAEEKPAEEVKEKPEEVPVEVTPEVIVSDKPKIKLGESNYQISLINENLLRIKVVTERAVEVDCFVKDKSSKSQSNKILVHPKTDGKAHEVEIVVSINPKTGAVEVQQAEEAGEEDSPEHFYSPDNDVTSEVIQGNFSKAPKKLLIDPDVADLVKKQTAIDAAYKPRTRQEIYEERLGPKNRYKLNREMLEKNLKRGAISALTLFFIMAVVIYSAIAGKKEEENEIRPEREIVIEDLPEMKLNVPFHEEPKQEESSSTNTANVQSPKITTPKIKRYNTPKIANKIDSTKKDDSLNIAKNNSELDKLRNGNQNSGKGDSTKTNYVVVRDSNSIGLDLSSNKWIVDNQSLKGMQGNIKGAENIYQIITDTANMKSYFMMYVDSDVSSKIYSENFKQQNDFPLRDSTLRGYASEEKQKDETVQYGFHIIDKRYENKITVITFVRKNYFNEYKPKIDDIVSRIAMPLKELPKLSENK